MKDSSDELWGADRALTSVRRMDLVFRSAGALLSSKLLAARGSELYNPSQCFNLLCLIATIFWLHDDFSQNILSAINITNILNI